MARILAIDDEVSILESYQIALDDLYDVITAESGPRGLALLAEERFDLVLLDISMPEIGGIEVLQQIRTLEYDCAVIMVTVHKDVEHVVEAMRAGADDYITKPFKVAELRHRIEQSIKLVNLERKTRSLEASLRATEERGEIVYASASMEEVFRSLATAAPTAASILITGESGTGKELAAQFVHEHSDRSDCPLITVNCAAIPETLLESELFGHEKGAFSGATERKIGKFEMADQGTVFLDEIGTLPLDLQSKLLRTIESRVIERVGGTTPIHLDVRWIAATNRDLDELVQAGNFREDLYFRLDVISVLLPPLRQRLEDIPALAAHFLEQYAREMKRPALKLSDEVLEVFQVYRWPGNVRELKNLIEQFMVLERGPEVPVDHLPERMLEAYQEEIGVDITEIQESRYKDAVEEFRRTFIVRAMRTADGNQAHAARLLGLHRNTLLHHLKTLDIKPEEYGQ